MNVCGHINQVHTILAVHTTIPEYIDMSRTTVALMRDGAGAGVLGAGWEPVLPALRCGGGTAGAVSATTPSPTGALLGQVGWPGV